ncbi:MAG: hypothetical protein V4503_00220, partial [Gemmatimonadota bacterium]
AVGTAAGRRCVGRRRMRRRNRELRIRLGAQPGDEVDAILLLAGNIAAGLEVRHGVIARHVQEQMPFMATERWLMLAVQSGGDRQQLHEVIRTHSHAVHQAVADGGRNDLLERLSADEAFARIDRDILRAQLDPAHYTGRSKEQVHEFLTEFLDPLVTRASTHAAVAATAEVRV